MQPADPLEAVAHPTPTLTMPPWRANGRSTTTIAWACG